MDLDAHRKKDAQVSVRLPAELLAKLSQLAKRRGVSRAALVLVLLRDGVRRLEEELRVK